ncbi:hypothetical protein BDY19DRAFT_616711 [Irpex rosettiformis]|uniref:Uncharacterized protein n=1 Tax=Irpex rosettiformis TaxID=378272 RepID=A0ACB8TNY8_9APHY|nr:hypothetical protein BDY19DRAFT_616711 [Irpex rosettiformis]
MAKTRVSMEEVSRLRKMINCVRQWRSVIKCLESLQQRSSKRRIENRRCVLQYTLDFYLHCMLLRYINLGPCTSTTSSISLVVQLLWQYLQVLERSATWPRSQVVEPQRHRFNENHAHTLTLFGILEIRPRKSGNKDSEISVHPMGEFIPFHWSRTRGKGCIRIEPPWRSTQE